MLASEIPQREGPVRLQSVHGVPKESDTAELLSTHAGTEPFFMMFYWLVSEVAQSEFLKSCNSVISDFQSM